MHAMFFSYLLIMKKRKIYLGIVLILLITILIVYLPGHLQKDEATPEPEIKLYLSKKDKIIDLKLEDYLVGTVAAEMPASFDLEALKAQAVCARTYAVRKIITEHSYPMGADLSDDITCCQAYRPDSEYEKMALKFREKIARAVKETRGEIMLYQEEPIDALYHSTCGGETESAADAWMNGCPYLQSIRCGYCKDSSHYLTKHAFSTQYIARQFGQDENKKINIKILDRTASSRVKTLSINNQEITGEKFRRILGLPSTSFTVAKDKDEIIITCHGYGHGVGLCQYGAAGMAAAGKKYQEILTTYYRGVYIYKMQY